MFSYMTIKWRLPVISIPILVMMSGLIIGAVFPETIHGLFGLINGFFAYIFDSIIWLYPVQGVIVHENGFEEVFYQDPGSIYNALRGFLTGFPTDGSPIIGVVILLVVIEVILFPMFFLLESVKLSRSVRLNNDTSLVNSENMDGSWVMGKRSKK